MNDGGAYYNEIEPAAVAVLRELIRLGLIAPGIVDDRSIREVQPGDLKGFTQCHFFAGAGLWSLAARHAGWRDDRPLWTASCPCQPFSQAGKRAGVADDRHLWPDVDRLVGACRPAVIVGEQVSGSAGYGWLDGVAADLDREGYTCEAVDIPAASVDAPHIRQRLYWAGIHADANRGGRTRRQEAQERESGGRTAVERDHVGILANRGRKSGQQISGITSSDEATDGRAGWIVQQPDGYYRHSSDDESPSMVHAAGVGRREGRAEPEFRSGRNTVASANAPGERVADAATPRQGRRQLHGLGEGSGTDRQRPSGELAGPHGSGVTLGDAEQPRLQGHAGHGGGAGGWPFADRSIAAPDGGELGDPTSHGWQQGQQGASISRHGDQPSAAHSRNGSFWSDAEWLQCHDGKARRTKPGLPFLVDGLAGRIPAWRLVGNSIVPELAAQFIAAVAECVGP